jgi:hypothetical protein
VGANQRGIGAAVLELHAYFVAPISDPLRFKPALLPEPLCLLGGETRQVFLVGSPKLTSNQRCYNEYNDT